MKNDSQLALPLPVVVLRLRALILALGERAGSSWWNSEFMNETGLRFLERLYPRTYFRAAIHAAGKAACDSHDRAVGRVGVYHLFRLPESLDVEINWVPLSADEDFVTAFRAALGDSDKLMEMLALICSRKEEAGASFGAKRIGSARDLVTHAAFGATAAIYHYAFIQGSPAFPYFAAERNESADDDCHR